MIKVTDESGADQLQVSDLMKGVPKSIKKAYLDGIYDTGECRGIFYQTWIEEIICPREGAILQPENKELKNRNDAIF